MREQKNGNEFELNLKQFSRKKIPKFKTDFFNFHEFREKELTDRVEFRFACQFDYISQLVELNLQVSLLITNY